MFHSGCATDPQISLPLLEVLVLEHVHCAGHRDKVVNCELPALKVISMQRCSVVINFMTEKQAEGTPPLV